jgi:hypothetical protein
MLSAKASPRVMKYGNLTERADERRRRVLWPTHQNQVTIAAAQHLLNG